MSRIPTTTGRGRRLGAQVSVWLSQEESAALDALAARYGPDVSRPEAVRRAVAEAARRAEPARNFAPSTHECLTCGWAPCACDQQ